MTHPLVRAFTELTPDPLLVFSRNGELEDCSAAARELTGIIPDDTGSTTLADLIGGDNAKANSLLLQALGQRQPTPVRLRLHVTGRATSELRGECWRLGGELADRVAFRLYWQRAEIGKFAELTATIDRLNREIRAKDKILLKLAEAEAETRRIEAKAHIGVWRWIPGEPCPIVSNEVSMYSVYRPKIHC